MDSSARIKVLIVVGARPNFMKAAPLIRAIHEHNRTKGSEIQPLLVHTGQHYDAFMSEQFFADLDLPRPDVHLGVEPGSHAKQTAEILQKFEAVLVKELPDAVIVVGDVNSTVACALATAKLPSSGGGKPLLAHVEAGLRSFDRTMPEEINRVLTDHLADLLFVTEASGIENLRREGISPEQIHFVGNTMIDSLLAFKERADRSSVLRQLGLHSAGNGNYDLISQYALITLHRPSNVDDLECLREILEGISELSRQMPILFPVHPRTRKRIQEFELDGEFQAVTETAKTGIRLLPPLGYLDFLCLMKNARIVLTDSGGIQEETTCLGVPCVTLRNTTERPVTINHGTNVLAGTTATRIRGTIARQVVRERRICMPERWDGGAAQRIVMILTKAIANKKCVCAVRELSA